VAVLTFEAGKARQAQVARWEAQASSRVAEKRPSSSNQRWQVAPVDRPAPYRKVELHVFRVELELHSAFLRRNGIAEIADLQELPSLLFPKHIRIVSVDWAALVKYLSRRGLDAKKVVERAKSETSSLHATMQFLRTNVGVYNPHRFLRTISPSGTIFDLLKSWSRSF